MKLNQQKSTSSKSQSRLDRVGAAVIAAFAALSIWVSVAPIV